MEVGEELATEICKFLKEKSVIFNPDMQYNVLYQLHYSDGIFSLNVIQVIDPVPYNLESWKDEKEFIEYLSKESDDSLQNLHIEYLKSIISK